MPDAIIIEGPTMDSLYPNSDSCKSWLSKHYNSIPLVLPILQMNKIAEALSKEGMSIERQEVNPYSFWCAG